MKLAGPRFFCKWAEADMQQGSEEEIHYLRHAINSLRQSLDQLGRIQRLSLNISTAPSVEQVFHILITAIPSILPALAMDGFFKKPDSQTVYQLRHFFEPTKSLPPIPEDALAWAQQRQTQSVLPVADGSVVFCPLVFQNLDLGYLLIYSSGDFSHYNETTGLALDILTEQSARAAHSLWNQASLEEKTASLQDTQQLLDSILESVPQPLVALDASGHLLLANGAADKLFGRNLNTLTGLHYQMVFPAEVAEAISEQYLPVQKGKTGLRTRIRFNSFQGELREQEFTASALVLHGNHTKGMVLIGHV
jgi:PAS domain S-box-containing protein